MLIFDYRGYGWSASECQNPEEGEVGRSVCRESQVNGKAEHGQLAERRGAVHAKSARDFPTVLDLVQRQESRRVERSREESRGVERRGASGLRASPREEGPLLALASSGFASRALAGQRRCDASPRNDGRDLGLFCNAVGAMYLKVTRFAAEPMLSINGDDRACIFPVLQP